LQVLPDIDIPLNWFLNFFGSEIIHRTITHTPLFGLIFLIPAFILWHKKKHNIAMYFFVITFGILLHLFLDYVFVADSIGGIMLFYPFFDAVYGLNLLQNVGPTFFAGIDAVILLLWLWHEEVKHKISDFI
jgi:membrane-bound metal-dependent hydrolase YbcI (DUF457 family)|tara:strand:+ start:426 stop:818 length:393 start_codon:yes stop_codon:yes gene_type:complete